MSTIKISDSDCTARIVTWQQAASGIIPLPLQGLNLGSNTYSTTAARVSNLIQVMKPLIGFLYCQLTSGALVANISMHQGTPNFGSPTTVLTMTGTNPWISVPLVFGRNDSVVNTGNNFLSVQTVSSGGAAVINRAGLILIGMFNKTAFGAVNKGYHEGVDDMQGLDETVGGGFDMVLTF